MSDGLLHPDWLRWLTALKDRVETVPAISAEQVVTGVFAVDQIPDLPYTKITMASPYLLGRSSAGSGAAEQIIVGPTLRLANGILGIKGLPSGYVIGDLLYASSATELARLADVAAGAYLRAGGVATAPAWQAAAALTKTNDTNVTLTLGGSASTALLNAASLTLGWTGQLAVTRGGTGLAAVSTGDLLYGSAANTLSRRSIGSAGDVLTVSGGLPVWAPTTGLGTGDLTRVDDTNVTLTLGGTPTGSLFKSVSLTLGWTGTLGVTRGGTGTGTAFTQGSVVFAGASGVYSQDNANLFWDATNHRLGLGTAAPGTVLDLLAAAPSLSNSVKGLLNVYTNDSQAADKGGSLTLGGYITGTSAARNFAGIVGKKENGTSANEQGYLALLTNNGGTLTEYLRIASDGKVGIGTAASGTGLPANRLHVYSPSSEIARVERNSPTGTGSVGVYQEGTLVLALGYESSAGGGQVDNGIASAGVVRGALGLHLAAGSTNADVTVGGITILASNGRVGFGNTAPTALIHPRAGTATANTAPLKFTSGTVLTTAEAGAIEFTTDDFFATITTGAARKAFILDDGARLTSGKIPIATTNGRLIDGQTPLAGTKVYYVSDTSGGAVTRKLTFTAGILTAET